ncbi:hypothetical protein Y1Q_0000801 [Alligator mississippiensis]|uniref:Uncharacterized protein n=1 Tax=Alligator mississippiensis TaxID=8496 RepID=A0A151PIS8_ALLMI|nr:hypothetical protein Y1Q_0000801 [Alligator mississippiensis]
MSKLLKAITNLIDSNQGNSRKEGKAEMFCRSEFKKLVQQDLAPIRLSPSYRYRHIKSLPESETEPAQGLLNS